MDHVIDECNDKEEKNEIEREKEVERKQTDKQRENEKSSHRERKRETIKIKFTLRNNSPYFKKFRCFNYPVEFYHFTSQVLF